MDVVKKNNGNKKDVHRVLISYLEGSKEYKILKFAAEKDVSVKETLKGPVSELIKEMDIQEPDPDAKEDGKSTRVQIPYYKGSVEWDALEKASKCKGFKVATALRPEIKKLILELGKAIGYKEK